MPVVVCGIDFSDRSASAVATAAAIASRLRDAELCLVHVMDPVISSLGQASREAARRVAETRIEKQAADLRPRMHGQVLTTVATGTASDTLLELAAEKHASLLVVSSLGHAASPLYRVGGTSERLVRSTDVPVLVVREAAPFEAWAAGERPLRALLAVDWTRTSEAAIRLVRMLREAGECDVVVGYVYYSDFTGDGVRRYGLPSRRRARERDPEIERLLARDLAARVGQLGGRGEVLFRPTPGYGRIGDHLLALAETERVDLIAVGTHHRRGLARLGSVAAVTLHHSHVSVAVAPLPKGAILSPDEVPCIRSVLAPTDFSTPSTYAVPFAYTLLGERGGDVHLLHVLPEGHDELSAIVTQLRLLVPKVGVPDNAVTRVEVVRHSNVPRAICEAADRLGVDAICIGSHGRSGFRRVIVGSVAEAVMRDCHAPVFIVRGPTP